MKHNTARLRPVLLLALLLPMFGGCATSSPPVMVPVECPQPQPVPAWLTRPAPEATFSQRAQADIQSWQQRLTGSQSRSEGSEP